MRISGREGRESYAKDAKEQPKIGSDVVMLLSSGG